MPINSSDSLNPYELCGPYLPEYYHSGVLPASTLQDTRYTLFTHNHDGRNAFTQAHHSASELSRQGDRRRVLLGQMKFERLHRIDQT